MTTAERIRAKLKDSPPEVQDKILAIVVAWSKAALAAKKQMAEKLSKQARPQQIKLEEPKDLP